MKLVAFPSHFEKVAYNFYSLWKDLNLKGYQFKYLFQNFDYVPATKIKNKVYPARIIVFQAKDRKAFVGDKAQNLHIRVHNPADGKLLYTVIVHGAGHGSVGCGRYTAKGTLRALIPWDTIADKKGKGKTIGVKCVEIQVDRAREYKTQKDAGVEVVETFDGNDWVEPMSWIDRNKLIFSYRARKSNGTMRFSQRSLVDCRNKINKKLAYMVVKTPPASAGPNQGTTANSDFIVDVYHKTNKRAVARVYHWTKAAGTVAQPDVEMDLTATKKFRGDKISTSFEYEGGTFVPDGAGKLTRLALSMRKNSTTNRVYRLLWVNLYGIVKGLKIK